MASARGLYLARSYIRSYIRSAYFIKLLATRIYSQRAFADKKRKAPTRPMIPYFGQERSRASARLEMFGIPVDILKGMMQDMGRNNNMKNTEKESIKL